jgi:carboxymethylenebutenolidase
MTTRIEIRQGLHGELALPESSDRAPCVIVVHEWHGLNDSVKKLAERFATEGFVALAPDLYRGQIATDDARAAELMNALSTSEAMDDLSAAVSTVNGNPRSNGKVGVVGFCMGGAMAFAAACAVDGIACAVPFYGIPVAQYWDAAKIRVPIQAHFAKHDGWAKPERAQALAEQVRARGGSMDLHVYDAGHAFMRAGDPLAYHPESAGLAWVRTLAFLRQQLT